MNGKVDSSYQRNPKSTLTRTRIYLSQMDTILRLNLRIENGIIKLAKFL